MRRLLGWLMLSLLVAVPPSMAEGKPVTVDEAAKMVQKQLGGRVLGGKTVEEGGGKFHVIRILTPDGRVQHIKVDSQTGKIVK